MTEIKRFDATAVDTSDYPVAPVGEYTVIITKSTLKETRAKNGSYLNLMVQIIKGDLKGLSFFVMVNYENQNITAQNIGRKQLAILCKAVGVTGLDVIEGDTTNAVAALHDTPILMDVGIQEASGDFAARNTIGRGGFSALDGGDEVEHPKKTTKKSTDPDLITF